MMILTLPYLVFGVQKGLECDDLDQKIFKNHIMWEVPTLDGERSSRDSLIYNIGGFQII